MPRFDRRWPLLLVAPMIAGLYIFGHDGFTVQAIRLWLGCCVSSMGALAFIGGEKIMGAIAFVVGILLVNL